MREKTRFIVIVISVLVAICFLFPSMNASSQEKKAEEKKPILLGGLFMLSGRGSLVGQPNYQGAMVAVDELNAKGGLLGRKFELLARDTKGQPNQAVKEAMMYILRDKVDFLYGTAASHEGLAVAEVAEKHKRILVTPEVTTDKFTVENFSHYTFRNDHMCRMDARGAALYIQKFPYKRWYIIAPDYEYGHDAVKGFKEELLKVIPDAVIVGEGWPKSNEPDYTPHIQKILEVKPDAVYNILFGGDVLAFIKQGLGFGLFDKIPCFSINGLADTKVLTALGKDMPAGIHCGAKYWFDYPYTPGNKAWADNYTKRFGEYPSMFTMCGYVGVMFLAKAIEKAGTINTEKVIRALEGITIDTPIGPQTMRKEDHQAIVSHGWGKTCKDPKYDFMTLCDFQVIPGEKIIPTVEEVLNWRKAAKK